MSNMEHHGPGRTAGSQTLAKSTAARVQLGNRGFHGSPADRRNRVLIGRIGAPAHGSTCGLYAVRLTHGSATCTSGLAARHMVSRPAVGHPGSHMSGWSSVGNHWDAQWSSTAAGRSGDQSMAILWPFERDIGRYYLDI